MSLDQSRLLLFEFAKGEWSELAPGKSPLARSAEPFGANLPVWSRDGRFLYFQNVAQEESAIYRVRVHDRHLERVAGLGDVTRRVIRCLFTSLGLDGSPIVTCTRTDAEVYALDWDAR